MSSKESIIEPIDEDYLKYRAQMKVSMISRLNHIGIACIERADMIAGMPNHDDRLQDSAIYYDLSIRAFATILQALEGME